ncbi:hypothetical protein H6785_03795 [Candidatus Nomurabacteria bacterium]|nr:hypothetical protein [Candidatus Nomurabacteria bacterium]
MKKEKKLENIPGSILENIDYAILIIAKVVFFWIPVADKTKKQILCLLLATLGATIHLYIRFGLFW